MTRPSSERDGVCICDYNPESTDGPQEDCPFHGRPYAYWVERGDALQARLTAALAPFRSMADHCTANAKRDREDAKNPAFDLTVGQIDALERRAANFDIVADGLRRALVVAESTPAPIPGDTSGCGVSQRGGASWVSR